MTYFVHPHPVLILMLICATFLYTMKGDDTENDANTTPEAAAAGVENTGPSSVTINTIRPFDQASGYAYVEAVMQGTVDRGDAPSGTYIVPVILIYPNDGGNGVGIVDWPNTSELHNGGFTATADRYRPTMPALRTTDNYLFENGFSYATVQWDKAVTDYFGPSAPDDSEQHSHLIYGTIEEAGDAFTILRDIASFLKDPGALEGTVGLVPADAVLSFGYSQSALLQMEFMVRDENLGNGRLAYDGHLLAKAGLLCWKHHNEPPGFAGPDPCSELPDTDGSKVIHVAAQGDVEELFNAGLTRFPDNPDWRQYELAGVSHLPAPILPGLNENQNPASSKPVFRAALYNLSRWVTEGIPAPPSKFLEGTLNADGTFDTDLDEYGNALGGLRLPHMEHFVDGTIAGAPLGKYTGKHPEARADDFFWLGGYFKSFTEEELTERYPDRETYVKRVMRAVDYLMEAGYILEEDRDNYVKEAQGADLTRVWTLPASNSSKHDNSSHNLKSVGGLVPVGDGVELYYEKTGNGEPLVLLHFFSGSTIIWEPFLDELTRHFRVINIDMRGHGHSNILSGKFRHRESAQDVVTLLDSLGIDRFRAVGMSSGAMTLLHIARKWPERLKAMVLVGGTHRYTEESRQIHSAPDCSDLSDTAMETWQSRHVQGATQIHALLNAWCGFSEVMGEDMNLSPDSLANIQARTLIVHGDRDIYFPVEIPVEMYKGIPDAALWVIPNGSHLPVFDPDVRTEFLHRTAEFFLAGD